MIQATQLKPGSILQKGADFFKVVSTEFAGTAQTGRTVKLKAKNLVKGNVVDMAYKADELVQEADLVTVNMEYLYEDGDDLVFMDQASYEQITVPANRLGNAKVFLQPNMEFRVQMNEGRPLQVLLPESVEMRVTQVPPSIGQGGSNFKEAELENGVKVLVPQFIKEGDKIVVEVETGRYMDRVKKEK